jgi:hypothetical protein
VLLHCIEDLYVRSMGNAMSSQGYLSHEVWRYEASV